MARLQATLGNDNIRPLSMQQRTVGFFGIFSIWVAANFVITTILTGMLLLPDISFLDALKVIFLGSAIGAIPIALMGRVGTNTGLPTMVITRAAFGQKGSLLPAAANTIILVGWSWIQAYMAGLSFDYAVHFLTGYSNINLFTILTQAIVVLITIYGIRGIDTAQRFISTAMLILSFMVFYKLFTAYDVHALIQLQLSENPETTFIIAFDIVIATAFSWMSSVCDYNRSAKSETGGMIATYIGYVLASMVAFGLGAAVGGFSLVLGMEQTYDPVVLLAAHGFGLIAAIVVFLSVVSTNAMALYSANMSFLNVFPKTSFWKTAIVLGIITVAGALLKERLMTHFFDFVLFIATLYIPIFAIVLADYYIVKKRNYDAEDIAFDTKGLYRYVKGVHPAAYVAYVLSAAFALFFTYVSPLAIGSTVLTFFVSGILYVVLSKVMRSSSIENLKGKKAV
ncbi:cytosine permease [Siminovitchia terrae]|uniref:purine-cytosine permease family protein n=1 Tax=Siminovitchia terrae TaxID=1914933 RepID=UPI001B1643A2|nr:cytosine permease [Siminovitchia terrae]GIN89058.1 cytosine permease [Siminovitchia terrae]